MNVFIPTFDTILFYALSGLLSKCVGTFNALNGRNNQNNVIQEEEVVALIHIGINETKIKKYFPLLKYNDYNLR